MCNPALLIAASAATTMAGQAYSGMVASSQAKYAQKIDKQNIQLAREQASDAIATGQQQQEDLGRQVAQRVGQQVARLSANNVDPTFGSAARTVTDTIETGRLDSSRLNESVAKQVRGLQIDSLNYENDFRAKAFERKTIPIATGIDMLNTALGSATQYAKFKAAN